MVKIGQKMANGKPLFQALVILAKIFKVIDLSVLACQNFALYVTQFAKPGTILHSQKLRILFHGVLGA